MANEPFNVFWIKYAARHPEHATRAMRDLAFKAWRAGRISARKP